jgi:hypothetical protein
VQFSEDGSRVCGRSHLFLFQKMDWIWFLFYQIQFICKILCKHVGYKINIIHLKDYHLSVYGSITFFFFYFGRFFGLLILYTVGRTPWTGDQPVAKAFHVLCGIRTHDPSVRASEDSSCFRPCCRCDQRMVTYIILNIQFCLTENTLLLHYKSRYSSGKYSFYCENHMTQYILFDTCEYF